MTPLDTARALWREHFPDHTPPKHRLRVGGGALLHDGKRIVRVAPPPKRHAGHQLQEVLVIEGMCERVIMRSGAWCER